MSTAETLYRERTPRSRKMFDEVSRLIPGGVTGTGFLHPYPSYIVRANGCYLYDVDGNRLTDFMNGAFVLPLGHNHPKVRRAMPDYVHCSGSQIGCALRNQRCQHRCSVTAKNMCMRGSR